LRRTGHTRASRSAPRLPISPGVTELSINPVGVRLLVVDPRDERRAEIVRLLADAGYGSVLEAGDAVAGAHSSEGRVPDLVLLALEDAEYAAATVDALRVALGTPEELPVIGLTVDARPESRARAAALGIFDVAVLPIDEAELRLRIGNALANGRLRRLLAERSARLTEALRGRDAENDTLRETLSVLAAMADYHDDDADHHAQRVGVVSAAIGRALELPEVSVQMLRAAAPLHDIGKVGISRRILLKPDKLTPSEWLHMQHHVEIGARILGGERAPVLVLAAEIARTHHERFDGTGYVAGLQGDEIPLSGRIVAVADVWDTLTHDRPYRPAWEPERALEEILSQAGAQFDPRVVEAFASLDLPALERVESDASRAA
jgi:putative two-component system response regulator